MIVHLFLRNFMLTPESFSASGGSNPGMVGITVKRDRRELNICQQECGDYGRYRKRLPIFTQARLDILRPPISCRSEKIKWPAKLSLCGPCLSLNGRFTRYPLFG